MVDITQKLNPRMLENLLFNLLPLIAFSCYYNKIKNYCNYAQLFFRQYLQRIFVLNKIFLVSKIYCIKKKIEISKIL